MDKKKIIEKFKKEKKLRAIMKLEGKAEVVGTEVDNKNQLHYVVRNGKEFSVIKAERIRPISTEIPSNAKRLTIRSGKIVHIE